MKIALLSPFYPYRGGIAQFSANIYDTLRQNHEVLPYNFTRQYPDILFPGKTQYVTPADKAMKVDSIRILDSANPLSYIKAAREIRKQKPDLLIIRYWMSYFGPSLGYVARHMDPHTKVIAIMDNVIPHEQRFFDKPFTRYFVDGVDGFVTMSDVVKEDLLTFKPNAKCMHSPHPLYNHFGTIIDQKVARERLRLDPNKKTLLFFGLIRDYKGLDILIQAMDYLDDSYQLVIAGEPYGSYDKYAELIAKSSHKNDIHSFNYYIDDSEVAQYFSASDVCVLPYRSATQSGIASVSYHFEVPMITTDVGGLREAVSDPGAGITVESTDPEAIAEGIKAYFANDDKDQFKENIRKLKKELSWESFADKLIDFAKQI